MLATVEKFVNAVACKDKEGFRTGTTGDLLAILISFVVVYGLVLLFGKFLWNNYLVRLLPVVTKADSILDILAVSILVRLLFC